MQLLCTGWSSRYQQKSKYRSFAAHNGLWDGLLDFYGNHCIFISSDKDRELILLISTVEPMAAMEMRKILQDRF